MGAAWLNPVLTLDQTLSITPIEGYTSKVEYAPDLPAGQRYLLSEKAKRPGITVDPTKGFSGSAGMINAAVNELMNDEEFIKDLFDTATREHTNTLRKTDIPNNGKARFSDKSYSSTDAIAKGLAIVQMKTLQNDPNADTSGVGVLGSVGFFSAGF